MISGHTPITVAGRFFLCDGFEVLVPALSGTQPAEPSEFASNIPVRHAWGFSGIGRSYAFREEGRGPATCKEKRRRSSVPGGQRRVGITLRRSRSDVRVLIRNTIAQLLRSPGTPPRSVPGVVESTTSQTAHETGRHRHPYH